MCLSHRLPYFFTFAGILCASFVSGYNGIRIVKTSFGQVRGVTVRPSLPNLSPVNQYLGVPYGQAPVGMLRFNMTISASKWVHMTKDADRLSKVCTQMLPSSAFKREDIALSETSAHRFDHVHRLLVKLKDQSEDCLYMNLYVPQTGENIAPLPVLVIVHGDEFGWNSGNAYNGTELAAFGRIIVVTLNYRLGPFGFLARCEFGNCNGNQGVYDLIAALKMLSSTLKAFNGDREAVTLLGWGSGASLVSILMSSPMSAPSTRLFRRAILLDGSALAPWGMSKNPQPYFYQLAEKLKCVKPIGSPKKKPLFQRTLNEIVRCMQEHGPTNLTYAARSISTPTFLSSFAPFVDGQIVPNTAEQMFSEQYGSRFREIDLLVGMTTNPAHHLLPNEFLKNGITKEQREKIFRTLVRNLYSYHHNEILAAIINEYTDWENPVDNKKVILNGVLEALNDVLFTVPTIDIARLHSLPGHERDSNTYMFVFSHETDQWKKEQSNSAVRGSLGGDTIAYILGYPVKDDDQLYPGFNSRDKEVSKAMMLYISNFIKYGSPLKQNRNRASVDVQSNFMNLLWPPFTQTDYEQYLDISQNPNVKKYYRNARFGFWRYFVPQLDSTVGKPPSEHDQLTDFFNKAKYFGTIRTFGSYANDPFPPPLPPPTPILKGMQNCETTVGPPVITTVSPPAPITSLNTAQSSTMLSVTVAVGCGLLFLNICIGLGLYRQCNKRDDSKKKVQLQYQTYAANLQPGGDINYNLNSPLSQQEPLLSNNKAAVGLPLRPGVSPTCPRHGRAAIALASGRNNSLCSQNPGPTLEEIQV